MPCRRPRSSGIRARPRRAESSQRGGERTSEIDRKGSHQSLPGDYAENVPKVNGAAGQRGPGVAGWRRPGSCAWPTPAGASEANRAWSSAACARILGDQPAVFGTAGATPSRNRASARSMSARSASRDGPMMTGGVRPSLTSPARRSAQESGTPKMPYSRPNSPVRTGGLGAAAPVVRRHVVGSGPTCGPHTIRLRLSPQ
jgi:hypothetical protein